MTRDSNIPLFLWIATALLAHLAWGGGASKLSKAFEETLDIKRFAASVQRQIRSGGAVEVALLDDSANESTPPEEAASKSNPNEEETDPADPSEEQAKEDESSKKAEELAKKEEAKPEEEKPKPEEPKPEAKKEEPKKEEGKPEEPKQLPKVQAKKRVAVVQHVEDPNQKDNPNAAHIADQANRVKKETQARITSTDQNDPKPTPGGAHAAPDKTPGNSDESRVAQSDDHAGEANKAPTSPDDPDKPEKSASAQAPPPSPGKAPKAPGIEKGSDASKQPGQASAQAGQTGQAAKEEVAPAPDTLNSGQGNWSVAEAKAAQAAQKARKARKKRLPPMKGSGGASDMLGLGALGTTSSGVNLNLSPQQALAAVGRDRLVKEKNRDAERRKSAHRGSWKSLGIERWRASIENYVASVKPGNQTALNTARVPFASYLNAVHNRLHPIFADSFLASLDSLPGNHPMNRADIKTDLEIVLDKDEGKVVKMGVTHTSGVTAFDIAALESVMRASPFGAPPRDIVSPDGKVYFHWEFYRNPFYACSTYFAHPFILKGAPKSAPPSIEPAPWRPGDPKESSPADQRHGLLDFTPMLEKRASLK
ncbi:MAG: hypothetical protein HYZ29_14020 [Myxococcales bacterium]|nr:hypothetical protein [Myxococcales bacterium]